MTTETEDGRCRCCDLPEFMCANGLVKAQAEQARAERSRALQQPGVTAAAYPGNCATCRTRYTEGEPIRRTEDGWSSVLCCPPEDS